MDSCCHVPEDAIPDATLDTRLDAPMSRASLLQVLGGGAALLLTARALEPVATLAAPPIEPEAVRGAQQAEYLCLIVLDGGRPDYITQNLARMPAMRSLLRRSRLYTRAWVGDLMSITPPGHAVIGTGSFPKNDGGIVNWDWGVHSTGKISPTTQALENYQNGWVFRLIKASGTPTLAGVIRNKYPNDAVIAGSGSHFHAAGPLGGPDASWIYSYQRVDGHWAPFTLGQHPVPARLLNDPALRAALPTTNHSTVPVIQDPLPLGQQDSLVVDFAIKALQQHRPRAIMINLPEVDTVGHWSRKWFAEEALVYRAFDRSLGRLIDAYKAEGIYDKTLFVITADHGMIQSKHRVLVSTCSPRSPAQMGRTSRSCSGKMPGTAECQRCRDAMVELTGDPSDLATQQQSDAEMNLHVNALIARARSDLALEKRGLLANTIPGDERPVVHWKRRLAVTAVGLGVLGRTGAGLAKAVAAVRRQGTGIEWTQ